MRPGFSSEMRLIGMICFGILCTQYSFAQTYSKAVRSVAAHVPTMQSAYQLLRQGRYSEAMTQYDSIYWKDKENYNRALFYIIYCQDKLGEIAKAQAKSLFKDGPP